MEFIISFLIFMLIVFVIAAVVVFILSNIPGAPAFASNVVWAIAGIILLVYLVEHLSGFQHLVR